MSFSIERTVKEVFIDEGDSIQKLFTRYLDLLFKWHESNNIVSSSDHEYVIKREIFDSYKLNSYLCGDSYTDIGSGGGIPGVIIAILNPKKKVFLIDRKSSFIDYLRLAKAELDLGNVEIINRDVLKSDLKFTTDTVIIKNFSNKKISKMSYEKKFSYLMNLIKKSKSVSKAYMLTGSPVLELSSTCLDEFNINTHVINSPYFETNRIIAEVKFENIIYS